MSKFGKKLVLTALIISMLGYNVQPLFSYADEGGTGTETTVNDQNANASQDEQSDSEEKSAEEANTKENAADQTPAAQNTEDVSEAAENKEDTGSASENTDVSGEDEEKKQGESSDVTESTDTGESSEVTESTDTGESSEAIESGDSGESSDTNESAEEEPGADDSEKNSNKNALADGTWKVLTTTDDYMFHIAQDAEGKKYSLLVVDGDKMTATITLTGTGYDYLYMGTKEEAAAASKSTWTAFKEVNGYYTYTFDISKLDKDLTIASHSKRLGNWYQHTITFYTDKAVALSLKSDSDDGDSSKNDSSSDSDTPIAIVPKKKNTSDGGKTSGTQKKFKNDNKADKVSKYTDDSNKSTSSVDNGTTLADGVYTPDGFSWAGGSGRLAYIRCNKLTVSGGKVLATIEFGSYSYDQCKASGNIYYKNGSGLSTFVIPVELNKNNTIIARTTAMSSPHWVKYTIYIAKAVGSESAVSKTDKKVTEKLAEEAPSIMGLESEEEAENAEVISAKYFQIFSYDNGVKLIQVDMTSDTYMESVLKKKEAEEKKAAKKAAKSKKSDSSEAAEDTDSDVEYDEEGNPIAKSQTEITEELYQNKIVNYLVVPKDVEIPAGLDKTYILIQQPANKTFTGSKQAMYFLNKLNKLNKVKTIAKKENQLKYSTLKKALKKKKLTLVGELDNLDYKAFVLGKTNMALLPASTLPDVIDKSKDAKLTVKEQKAKAEAKEAQYVSLTTRFTALGIPVLVDRSSDEETKVAKAEWIKVYGIIYGCEDEADAWFAKYVKKYGTEEEIKALEGNTSDEQ